MTISDHAKADLFFYVFFLLGQFVFALSRASKAIRSKENPVKTRREFFYHNWDVLLIRAGIEFVLFFLPWRHYSTATLLSYFGLSSDNFVVNLLTIASESPSGAGALGFAADSLFDWLSLSEKIPGFLRNWIKENIPGAPQAPQTP